MKYIYCLNYLKNQLIQKIGRIKSLKPFDKFNGIDDKHQVSNKHNNKKYIKYKSYNILTNLFGLEALSPLIN